MYPSLSTPFSITATLACLLVLALAACSSTPKASDGSASLRGGEWRLVTMQGAAISADLGATLEFADDQKISGRAFINQYFGSYTLGSDGSLAVGPVGATRMAGPEPLMQQENTFISLLAQVDRYQLQGDTLTLKQGDKPLLVFQRKQ